MNNEVIINSCDIRVSSSRKYYKDNPFYGIKHTEETKKKISIANKGKLVGKKNPMTNPEVAKRCAESRKKNRLTKEN